MRGLILSVLLTFLFSVAAGLVTAFLVNGLLKPRLDVLVMYRGRPAAQLVIGGIALGVFLLLSLYASWERGRHRPRRGDISRYEFLGANFTALLLFIIPALLFTPLRGGEIKSWILVFYLPYISFREHLGFTQLSALFTAGVAGGLQYLCFLGGRRARDRFEHSGKQPKKYGKRP